MPRLFVILFSDVTPLACWPGPDGLGDIKWQSRESAEGGRDSLPRPAPPSQGQARVARCSNPSGVARFDTLYWEAAGVGVRKCVVADSLCFCRACGWSHWGELHPFRICVCFPNGATRHIPPVCVASCRPGKICANAVLSAGHEKVKQGKKGATCFERDGIFRIPLPHLSLPTRHAECTLFPPATHAALFTAEVRCRAQTGKFREKSPACSSRVTHFLAQQAAP